MKQSIAIQHYSNPLVMKELVRVSQDREVGTQLQGGFFGKRPDILQFPKEVESLGRNGVTSFHVSQERWSDPMQLSSDSTRRQLDTLRIGWDLIIDIDCPWFDYSTIAAETVVEALEFHGVEPQVKFSGNRGWHIAIPFEAFPEVIGKKKVQDIYEQASEALLRYLRDFISDAIWVKIKEKEGDIRKIVEKTGVKREEFMKPDGVDIINLIELDLALGKSRHLIRAPYSLHEKTGLVSLPIKPEDISKFNREWARPEVLTEINASFLNREHVKEGSANQLLVQALDWREEKEEEPEVREIVEIEGKVHEKKFPPCMKLILNGVNDGKKRALFALLNFLKCCNWTWPEIEQRVKEWNNDKNAEPLKEGYIIAQLNWHKRNPKKVPPSNCKEYYQEIGVCQPDNLCNTIKNPLSYVKRKKL
jgi:DNA primase large subunit